MRSERQSSRTLGAAERGQSVFDYSIGVSLFVIVVLGVLVFVPTAFGSFGGGVGGDAGDGIAAQRGADYLAGTALSAPDEASTFRTSCTQLFFAAETSSNIGVEPTDCGIEQDAPLAANLSLSERQPVNVTIERDTDSDGEREILCWNEDGDELVTAGSGDCVPGSGDEDIVFSAGSSAVKNGNFVAAERFGTLGGTGVYVVVRTW